MMRSSSELRFMSALWTYSSASQFLHKVKLGQHMLKFNLGKVDYTGEICSLKYDNPEMLKHHLRAHLD